MTFQDPTDTLRNGLDIEFTHVATGENVSLKAFLTSWKDNFKQSWKPHDGVGRMDSIMTYQRTSRNLTFSLDIPSSSTLEATANFNIIQKLIQMSYPVFDEITIASDNNSNAQRDSQASLDNNAINTATSPQTGQRPQKVVAAVMTSPPFFNIRFSNWANTGDKGVYGAIENIEFSPDLSPETGGFYGNKSIDAPSQLRRATGQTSSLLPYKILIPKLMKLSITMNVVNIQQLGYRSKPREDAPTIQRSPDYPYAVTDDIVKKAIEKENMTQNMVNSIPTHSMPQQRKNLFDNVQDFFQFFKDQINNRNS